MNIIPFEKKHYSIAQEFIQTHEKYSVILSYKLFQKPEWIFLLSQNQIISSQEQIIGIVSVSRTILHCLPFARSSTPENILLQQEFIQTFAEFLKTKKVECLNGEAFGSALILSALKLNNILPSTINDYDLMELNIEEFSKIPLPTLPQNHQIIRCKPQINPHYKNQLFQLQKEYEIEEVLPPSMPFSELACKIRLNNFLQNQYFIALKTPTDEFIAKAGTNAIGKKFIQLGGIYTKKSQRRKGFSFILIYTILKRILRVKKSAILFVKKSNLPAINLYKSLSFNKISDYIISYFVYND